MASTGFTLFAGALVSAILSTVDSALLVSSSLFSHNIVGRLRPDLDERSKLRVARTCTIAFGLVSFALASTPSSVGDLIDLTNGFGSAGVFVLLVFGLFTRIGGAGAALGALLSGAGLFSIGYLREWSFPYLTALGGALAAYLALALVSKAPNPVDALKQGT